MAHMNSKLLSVGKFPPQFSLDGRGRGRYRAARESSSKFQVLWASGNELSVCLSLSCLSSLTTLDFNGCADAEDIMR